ncbi:heterokaryon incompatibility protein-domain-containing protein [Cadophora sp. MPI-SDFR-AT-0126]|nr:heterokaryon incompatibility protein-domain-containing protein [Leotiomycetes sp. MPI-SDFR-AT-0126]
MALQYSSLEDEASVYSNLPLPDPRSIRILNILPGRFGDIVECTLEVVDLNAAEKPQYEALSYVWGPIGPPVMIKCNSQAVKVTPNLGAALQRIRYPESGHVATLETSIKSGKHSPDGRIRRIWIDALSINQKNLDERSKQVSFMKDIYDNAKDVVIWLGEVADLAPTAISLIRRVAERARAVPGRSTGMDVTTTYEPNDNSNHTLPTRDDKGWDAVD